MQSALLPRHDTDFIADSETVFVDFPLVCRQFRGKLSQLNLALLTFSYYIIYLIFQNHKFLKLEKLSHSIYPQNSPQTREKPTNTVENLIAKRIAVQILVRFVVEKSESKSKTEIRIQIQNRNPNPNPKPKSELKTEIETVFVDFPLVCRQFRGKLSQLNLALLTFSYYIIYLIFQNHKFLKLEKLSHSIYPQNSPQTREKPTNTVENLIAKRIAVQILVRFVVENVQSTIGRTGLIACSWSFGTDSWLLAACRLPLAACRLSLVACRLALGTWHLALGTWHWKLVACCLALEPILKPVQAR